MLMISSTLIQVKVQSTVKLILWFLQLNEIHEH